MANKDAGLKNIGWYSKGGHLDLFCKLDKRLKADKVIGESSFVCHTKEEENKIKKIYFKNPKNLGSYFLSKEKEFEFRQEEILWLEREYDFLPLKRILWSEYYERNFSDQTLFTHLILHFSFWEDFLKENEIDLISWSQKKIIMKITINIL